MAAADLRDELNCSICLSIYTDPVMLPCGHNFCQGCIGKALDTQEGSRSYSCPECREEYQERPALNRNRTLRNIAEIICLILSSSEKKKEKLRKVLEQLSPKREETEREVQRLQERRREVAEKAAGETERITDLFRDIREQLEVLEKQLLSEISSQKEEFSLQLSHRMEQLEIKKDELSWKIHHIEELCNMAGPLIVLQERESDEVEVGDENEEEDENDDELDDKDLDVALISETLLTGLAGIVTGVKGRIYGQEATDLLLDINTAHKCVALSEDRKTATWSDTKLCYPRTPERFRTYPQVLSSRNFTCGRHYWEVETSGLGDWDIGVACPSIVRKGDDSAIGHDIKSWSLCKSNNEFYMLHASSETLVPSSCLRFRISLDYEAGHLSFYELSEPIRHLHTFTATFTEPLHPVFSVIDNAWVRICS
ncbi:E3 ubiquitin-protein ligase TRIM39 [Xenopus laevis]|uniref:E3 ubiquitin-protein ligase TRIM39 n=1 Tax=Xenopus laevis TaxID=8355 RepID=A0A8J0U474_XENLA|nr:E3 ubiquitin-protein ligase TRIM39 [Xenopus laevis]OCT58411.1 hypothetical protein XELAEV_18002349mg [Xenopus laevis]